MEVPPKNYIAIAHIFIEIIWNLKKNKKFKYEVKNSLFKIMSKMSVISTHCSSLEKAWQKCQIKGIQKNKKIEKND